MNGATSGLVTNMFPFLSRAGTIKNRAYAVVSGVEGMVLDGTHYRNLGGAFFPPPLYRPTTARWPSSHTQRSSTGMINHSARYANAELQCFFDRGAEQAVITATQFIPKVLLLLALCSPSTCTPATMLQLANKH